MAQTGEGNAGETSAQASLGTVLAAIKDIQRSHNTSVVVLEKAFDDKLEELRREMADN